jgi:hypothetical protein
MEGAIALVTPLLSDIWAVFKVVLDLLRELIDFVDDQWCSFWEVPREYGL